MQNVFNYILRCSKVTTIVIFVPTYKTTTSP